MRELESMKEDLRKNIVMIEKNYDTLSKELTGLRNSKEKIALEARSLGYYRENEGVIIVDGYEGRNNFFALGKLVNIESPERNRKPLFRAVAFAAVLLSLIFILIFSKKQNGNKKIEFPGPRDGSTL